MKAALHWQGCLFRCVRRARKHGVGQGVFEMVGEILLKC